MSLGRNPSICPESGPSTWTHATRSEQCASRAERRVLKKTKEMSHHDWDNQAASSADPTPARAEDTPAASAIPSPAGTLRQMLVIAGPSIVTMSSYAAMQFVDRLMVKEIGPEPWYVAAQGTAGITTWTLMTFCVGLTGVISSFVSQNLGAGKPERGAAYAWTSMWIGAGYWALIMLPAAVFAPQIFTIFGHADAVRQLEVEYAVIAMGGAVFTLAAKGIHNYFFGMHRPGVVMAAVVLANLTNIFANVVLIFGPEGLEVSQDSAAPIVWLASAGAWVAQTLGIEAMGLAGAALGTVIGTVVELGLPLLVFLGPASNRAYRTRAAWRPKAVCVRDVFRVGWPAGLMFVNELICWAYLMSFLVGRAEAVAVLAADGTPEQAEAASTMATTTGFIALQWMHLSFMPAVGFSIATQAMVGKAVGARALDHAARVSWLGVRLTMGYMGLCALLYVVMGEELTALFVNADTPREDAARMIRLGGHIMIAAAVFQLFDAIAITLSAALRGAGDTVWPGVATILLSWTCIVGFGNLLLVAAPGLGAIGPWVGASAYIVLLGIALWIRFVGGRWRTIRLVHDDTLHNLPPDEVLPAPGPEAI